MGRRLSWVVSARGTREVCFLSENVDRLCANPMKMAEIVTLLSLCWTTIDEFASRTWSSRILVTGIF